MLSRVLYTRLRIYSEQKALKLDMIASFHTKPVIIESRPPTGKFKDEDNFIIGSMESVIVYVLLISTSLGLNRPDGTMTSSGAHTQAYSNCLLMATTTTTIYFPLNNKLTE